MGIIAVDIVFMFRYLGGPQVGTDETFLTRSQKGSNTMTTTPKAARSIERKLAQHVIAEMTPEQTRKFAESMLVNLYERKREAFLCDLDLYDDFKCFPRK